VGAQAADVEQGHVRQFLRRTMNLIQ
jgi:hypothetical protein